MQAAAADTDTILRTLETAKHGLTEAEAERRLKKYGLNSVAEEAHYRKLVLLGKAIVNPLVILLDGAGGRLYFFATGDNRAGIVMNLMVVLGVVLRFVQEARADTAAEKLKEMIRVTATVHPRRPGT